MKCVLVKDMLPRVLPNLCETNYEPSPPVLNPRPCVMEPEVFSFRHTEFQQGRLQPSNVSRGMGKGASFPQGFIYNQCPTPPPTATSQRPPSASPAFNDPHPSNTKAAQPAAMIQLQHCTTGHELFTWSDTCIRVWLETPPPSHHVSFHLFTYMVHRLFQSWSALAPIKTSTDICPSSIMPLAINFPLKVAASWIVEQVAQQFSLGKGACEPRLVTWICLPSCFLQRREAGGGGVNSKTAPAASRCRLFCERRIINQQRGLCEKERWKGEMRR